MVTKPSRTLRAFIKPEFKDRYLRLSDKDWRELERCWEVSLPKDAREKLDVASRVYAMVGPPHERNTITALQAEKAFDAWIKASGRLRLKLGAGKTSAPRLTKREIVERFCGEAAARKIRRMRPMTFAHYVIEAAMGAARSAMAEKEHQQISPVLQKDLWRAWVAFVASVAREVEAKVSAASSNKTNKESPFVKGVIFLQERLPKECRRFADYDSVAKGVQAALRFKQTPEVLLGILAGWGAGIPKFGEYDSPPDISQSGKGPLDGSRTGPRAGS
jgi:hypothetical protein